jgi:hypothetical protein
MIVTRYGIRNASKNAYCNIFIDRSNLSEAPKDWDIRKNREPVL